MQNCENFAEIHERHLVNETYEWIPHGQFHLYKSSMFDFWVGNGQNMCKNLELITGERVPVETF